MCSVVKLFSVKSRHLKYFTASGELSFLIIIHPDLLIRQIAGRLRRERVGKIKVGAYAQSAAAGRKERADPASAFYIFPAIPQPFKQRLIGIAPYLAEWTIMNIAQIIVAPELIGMHLAVKVDAAYSNTAAVKAAAVPR